jgi:ornithine cyclodeaminase
MMVVLSARTGVAEAVLLDNAYLTDVRTGAAGAVAIRHLAPETVNTAGVVGTGAQGRYQILGLRCERAFQRLLAYDRDAESLERYVAEMAEILGVEVISASGPEEVVRSCDTVVTCTPSRQPYVRTEWLHPGLHITAMGADLPEKQELASEVAGRADIVVCDRRSQSFTMGELHRPFEMGILSENSPVAELGEIVIGKARGRSSKDQITLCDLSGTGVQDTAIAHLALQEAERRGLGTEIQMDGP